MSDDELCFRCCFKTSRWDCTATHYRYIIARDMEEAANLFNRKKYWQWILVEITRLGTAITEDTATMVI